MEARLTDSQSAAGYPLAHLKVLDLSRVLAGPFAGHLLCDLGADVVKVEPPDDLEDSEATGPLTSETWESGAGWILVSADFRYLWRMLAGEFGLADPTRKTMPLPGGHKDAHRRRRAAAGHGSLEGNKLGESPEGAPPSMEFPGSFRGQDALAPTK